MAVHSLAQLRASLISKSSLLLLGAGAVLAACSGPPVMPFSAQTAQVAACASHPSTTVAQSIELDVGGYEWAKQGLLLDLTVKNVGTRPLAWRKDLLIKVYVVDAQNLSYTNTFNDNTLPFTLDHQMEQQPLNPNSEVKASYLFQVPQDGSSYQFKATSVMQILGYEGLESEVIKCQL